MCRLLHLGAALCCTTAVWMTWAQSYTGSRIDGGTQGRLYGGVACNHRNTKLHCGAGLTNCGGDCWWENIGRRCTFYPGQELQASSGTIYICADASGQIHCETLIPTPAGQEQSCTLSKDCVCRDKGFPYIQQAECRQEDSTATVTYMKVTVTTDCQNE